MQARNQACGENKHWACLGPTGRHFRPWPHAPVHGGAEVAGTSLSIDELYRTQSLVGTTPEGYSWSQDGETVLFLWNDEGYSFRDIWS